MPWLLARTHTPQSLCFLALGPSRLAGVVTGCGGRAWCACMPFGSIAGVGGGGGAWISLRFQLTRLWTCDILAVIQAKLPYLIKKIPLPCEGQSSGCDSLGQVSSGWSPVILEELHLHFWRIALLLHKTEPLWLLENRKCWKDLIPTHLQMCSAR